MGYKRFSLLGAMLTAVILMIGSVLVILENITKIAHPQPVNENGILWLGIIAVAINVLASLVVCKGKTKNESILSLHFLEDTLGWVAVILMAIFSPIYGLVYLRSSLIACHFLLYFVKSHSTFLVCTQDFLRCCARRSRDRGFGEGFRGSTQCQKCTINSVFGLWMVWKIMPLSISV